MSNVKLAESDQDIANCFPVMSQLRKELQEDEFVDTVRRLMNNESYQLAYVEDDDGKIVTVAGFKLTENLDIGRFLYLDDLITDDDARSRGYGKMIMEWLGEYAKKHNCKEFILDSATFRDLAHKFYFRNNFHIYCYHFAKKL